jgi:hypothetical protein
MADGSDQLVAETQWLRGDEPGSSPAARGSWRPPEHWASVAERVEKVLRHPELAKFLTVLERHNTSQRTQFLGQPRGDPHNPNIRQSALFLIGPYLCQILQSVEARRAAHEKFSALDRPAADFRAHFQKAATKIRALAALLRKGPQPHVALAARSDLWDALTLFVPLPTILGASESATIELLDQILESAAVSFDAMAPKIPRAQQNKQRTKEEELRWLASSSLVGLFHRRLKHPYHAHVATIAGHLSGVATDADYVKKIEKRSKARAARGQNSQKL